MPPPMPDLTRLKDFLDTQLLMDEEIAMWMDAGFYVGLQKDENDSKVYRMILPDGKEKVMWHGEGHQLRQLIMAKWYARHKHDQVRFIEVDTIRESYEARNEPKI
jgi:hypothetical protein